MLAFLHRRYLNFVLGHIYGKNDGHLKINLKSFVFKKQKLEYLSYRKATIKV